MLYILKDHLSVQFTAPMYLCTYTSITFVCITLSHMFISAKHC